MQSPVLDVLSDEVGDVKFVKMDVDANPETPAAFGIRAIPTLLIKRWRSCGTLNGFHNKEQLAKILAKYTN